ncbi:unnamed protein product [Trichobilharzia regenti]|nr:unnamed protein product [Trichobilharzia regenti]
MFFWQLINAHEIPTSRFLPLIRSVDSLKHPEACSNLILLLKLEKPSFELVRALLSRRSANDLLSMTALHFWSCPDNQHSGRFSNILCSLISTPLASVKDSNSVSGGTSTNSGQNMKECKERRRSSTSNGSGTMFFMLGGYTVCQYHENNLQEEFQWSWSIRPLFTIVSNQRTLFDLGVYPYLVSVEIYQVASKKSCLPNERLVQLPDDFNRPSCQRLGSRSCCYPMKPGIRVEGDSLHSIVDVSLQLIASYDIIVFSNLHFDSLIPLVLSSVFQDDDIQSSLQSLAVSPKLSPNLKDRFSDLLALVEDLPSTQSGYQSKGKDSLSNSANTSGLMNGDVYTGAGQVKKGTTNRLKPTGKGGHSLRNLDSRRAAEAERRQGCTNSNNSSNSSTSSKRQNPSETQMNTFDGDSDCNEVISLTSDSSSCSSEDENESARSKKTRSGTTRSTNKSKSRGVKRTNSEMVKDRKPVSKRSATATRQELNEECTKTEEDDDDDDDDEEYEDRALQVVVVDEESGDESNAPKTTSRGNNNNNNNSNNENDDVDDDCRIRPSKRRKTAIKRFMLDD